MRRGDFDALWDEHAEPLFSFVAYRTGDRALAEEVVAETFAKAFAGRKGFDSRKAKEKTWLYTIALNLVRDHVRREGSKAKALERVAAGAPRHEEDAFATTDTNLSLHAALEQLSEEEREAIGLRYGAGLSAPEIARTLDEPLTTVEGRIYRALRKLRTLLDEPGA